ncbi:PEP-utilizing enzyme [Histidinibacterium aquaticum]|uniref:PEP-utilizing protein n=1 Tax=Histidinibacterium aquaticum TaxID=2613962 RepID=A0A5J5GIQ9_9RHOB|nr:PEP-utilizing enzyme [Histidinibacterium aquaticum]KAA9008116.1 PEP-utilizing protein [Histidinibacterium aquaticum]
MTTQDVLGQFLGNDDFPIDWRDGEADLFWIFDDLHCPNPLTPMFFDIGGWWLTCDHMFRRFGTPFASDWIAKQVNGYLYTAAIPADPNCRPVAEEFQSRYAPRVPFDGAHKEKIGGFLEKTLPVYGKNFMRWWTERYRPEITRNFEYFDNYDMDGADIAELAVLFEDALDMHDRHWKIHWLVNFAQFSATMELNAAIKELRPDLPEDLPGRLQSSLEDRNWDSIEALWQMKETVKGSTDLSRAFEGETAKVVLAELGNSETGRAFIAEQLEPYQKEFGQKSMWSHEFISPLWAENPGPIIEAVRGYLASDYDYPKTINAVRKDLEEAKAQVMDGLDEGPDRDRLQTLLDRSIGLNPLTPDHHFYIDQGTNARLRTILIAIGRKFVEAGVLDDPEDVLFLRYQEMRYLVGDPEAFDAIDLTSDRRDEMEEQQSMRPPDWIGTATEEHLAFPYAANWGFPEKFYREPPTEADAFTGLPACSGVIEGTARLVTSTDQFDDLQEDEILVCRMTNPAWVVLFTKIRGLVTDAGGSSSHSAVIAREFGIPAVVGTSVATDRIKTGDRVRVNGTSGEVQILR